MADGEARKPVSYWRLFRRHHGWAPLFALAMTVVMVLVWQVAARDAKLFDLYGAEAVAVVTDKETRTRRSGDNSTTTDYYLSYRFTSASGEQIAKVESVSSGFYRETAVGDEITVRYIAHDPRRTEVEIGSNADTANLSRIMSFVSALVAMGLAGWFGHSAAGMLRAVRSGEMREARITEHVHTNVRVNRQPRFRLAWIDAAYAEGKSGLVRESVLLEHPVGSVIRVYVDPKTGRSWWEGEV